MISIFLFFSNTKGAILVAEQRNDLTNWKKKFEREKSGDAVSGVQLKY